MAKSDEMGSGATIVMFACGVAGMFYRAYVLTILWGWYIAARFAAPRLGIADAIGVSIVVGMFIPHSDRLTRKDMTNTERWTEVIAQAAIAPSLALALGYIVKVLQ